MTNKNFAIKLNATLLIIIILSVISCVDVIELDVPRGQTEAISIEGKLVKGDPSFISVDVQKLFTFDGSSQYLQVSGVTIISENGTETKLNKDSDGKFSQEFGDDNHFQVELDIGYQIRVELLDGRIIESAFEEVQRIGADDHLSFSLEERETFDEETGDYISIEKAIVELHSTISNLRQDPKRLYWNVDRTYKLSDIADTLGLRDPIVRTKLLENKTCYVTDYPNPSKVMLFDGFSANRDEAEFSAEVFDVIANDHKFLDTMFINVVQESLSEGAFRYYEKISELISLTGNMFESPAGKLGSNFKNITNPDDEVFGYFYATEQKTSRIKITPDMIGDIFADENSWVFNKVGSLVWNTKNGKIRPLCLLQKTGQDEAPNIFGECPTYLDKACCDCLVLENSTTSRPEFFD